MSHHLSSGRGWSGSVSHPRSQVAGHCENTAAASSTCSRRLLPAGVNSCVRQQSPAILRNVVPEFVSSVRFVWKPADVPIFPFLITSKLRVGFLIVSSDSNRLSVCNFLIRQKGEANIGFSFTESLLKTANRKCIYVCLYIYCL